MKLPEQAEDRLALYSEIIRNLPLAVVGRDPQDGFRTVIWNHAAEDLIGIPAEEALGRSVEELFPGEEAAAIMESDRMAVEHREVVTIPEDRACSRRFRDLWFHTIKLPLFSGGGDPVLLVNIFQDITERKRSQDALRAAKDQLEGIVETVPDILIRIARDGTFLSVKCEDSGLLLAPKEAIPGTQLDWTGLTDEVVVKTRQALERVMNGEGVQSYQYSHEVPKGLRTFDCRMASSGADEAVIFIRDITGLEARSRTQRLAVSPEVVELDRKIRAVREQAETLAARKDAAPLREELLRLAELASELGQSARMLAGRS